MEIVDSVMALLFVADEPVPNEIIARILNVGEGQVDQAVEILQERLATGGPLQVIRLAGGWQLCTKPECAEIVAAFLKPQRQRLGRSLMEVLAIIAYRQPATMAEIDAARGVQSDYSIRQLVERRLVEEVGRKQTPGRPVLFGTTQQFLHQFNLNDLSQLPELTGEVAELYAAQPALGGDAPQALPADTAETEASDEEMSEAMAAVETNEDAAEELPEIAMAEPEAELTERV